MGHLVKVVFYLDSIFCIVVGANSLRKPDPIVFIRSINWLIDEFSDHWIHIVLTTPNIRFEAPSRPVSIAAAGQHYQVPSRHLQVNRVHRLILLLMRQHNEIGNVPEIYSNLVYENQRFKMRDCMDRIKPGNAIYDGCFEFPNTYAVWTSSWQSELGFGPTFYIPFDPPEYRLKYILFKTSLVGAEADEDQNLEYYDIQLAHGGQYPQLFMELPNCLGVTGNVSEPGCCRQEFDETNRQLQVANPGSNIDRRWQVYNTTSKICTWVPDLQSDSVETLLQMVAKFSRKTVYSPAISTVYFNPDRLGFELVIKYLTIQGIEIGRASCRERV